MESNRSLNSLLKDFPSKPPSVFSTITDDTGIDLSSPVKNPSTSSEATDIPYDGPRDPQMAPPLPPRPETQRNRDKIEYPEQDSVKSCHKCRSQSIGKLGSFKNNLPFVQNKPRDFAFSTRSSRNVSENYLHQQTHKELIFNAQTGFQLSEACEKEALGSRRSCFVKFSTSFNRFFRNNWPFVFQSSKKTSNNREPIEQKNDSLLRKRNKSENVAYSSLISSTSQRKSKSKGAQNGFRSTPPSYPRAPQCKEPRTAPTSPDDTGRCFRACRNDIPTSSGTLTSSGNVHHHFHHHVYHVHHIHHYKDGLKSSPTEEKGDKRTSSEGSTIATNAPNPTSSAKNISSDGSHLYNTYQPTISSRNNNSELLSSSCDLGRDNFSLIKLERNPNLDLFKASIRELKRCGWYWGPLKFQEAEYLLSNRPNGTFLVRDSGHDTNILSLSFRVDEATYHTRIEHKNGRFSFWSQPDSHSATSIIDFIHGAVEHSRSGKYHYFLQSSEAGRPPVEVPLLYPVSRHQTVQSLKQMCRFSIVNQSEFVFPDSEEEQRGCLEKLPLPPDLIRYITDRQYLFDNLNDIEKELRDKQPLMISTMDPFKHRNLSSGSNPDSFTPLIRRSRLSIASNNQP